MQGMDLNFEQCVACLKVQDRLCKMHWMEPPEEDGSACHMPGLLIFVWVVDGFCKTFHAAKDMVKRSGFNSPRNNFFYSIILTCSQIIVFFAFC